MIDLPDFSSLFAGRAQMGASLGFHIIYASLGVGLPLVILIAHFIGLRRSDPVWLRLAERITRAFAVLLVIGVISGIIISIELTVLWPKFMEQAGPVIGLPFSIETYAFFFEAIFLSLYMFARDRLTPWQHWATLIPVCLGAAASAIIVVAANAWMNTPVGFRFENGEFLDPDPYEAIFNPAMPAETFHMLAAAYVATGFTVAGAFAFAMLRGRRSSYERRGVALGMFVVILWIVPLGIGGDRAGRMLAENQPTKLAAAEALTETQRNAPLTIGGIVQEDGSVKYGLEIPSGLSLLVGRHPDAEVKGLEETPPDERPPVAPVHYAFDFMVAAGFALGALAVAFWIAAWRRPRWLAHRLMLVPIVLAGPVAFLSIEAGWIVTEVGRQPWIIYGYMKTEDALTSSSLVGLMFVVFIGLYVVMTIVTILTLRSEMAVLPRAARLTDRDSSDA